MSNEFDASLVHGDPVSAEILAEQSRTVDHLMMMPNALANARLHAENEMQRLLNACNRLAWGSVPGDLRAPTADETAALLQRLTADDQQKLMRDARLAAEQRALLAGMEAAQNRYLSQLQAEQDQLARDEQDAQEWAEFEAHDAAGREGRFHAWRASRIGGRS